MPPKLSYRNKQLLIDQGELISTALEETYLTADAAVGTSLTVANIDGFAVNKNLVINPFGETAEFVKTHASSAPSGTTITLAATTVFTHYTGEKVYLVNYNAVEFAHTTTTTGTKTALTTSTGNGLVSLQADTQVLKQSSLEYNSGYFFARYVNNIGITWTVSGDTFTASAHGLVNGETVKVIGATTLAAGLSTTVVYYVVQKDTNTFKLSLTNGGTAVTTSDGGTGTQTLYRTSTYTDPVIYTGWAANTVGYLIERSLRDLELGLSEKLTLDDCYAWINDGMRFIKGKLKRWPEHYSYNAVLGQTSRGVNTVTMPSDAYDTETNKSLVRVRIGDGANLQYVDQFSFENVMEGVKVTQVTTQATAADTSLYIDNSYDFEDSGSVNVYVSGTKYTITYTAVTRSATAGVLTGIPASGTGSISVTIPVDTNVWQDEDEGVPEVWTVRNGNVEFYPLPDSNEDNKNVYGDYDKVATNVDSDGDTIDFQRFDMLQKYLTWRIKCKVKKGGESDMKDGLYMEFKELLNDAIRTLGTSGKFPMRPRPNRMLKNPDTSFLRKANLQDLDISEQ